MLHLMLAINSTQELTANPPLRSYESHNETQVRQREREEQLTGGKMTVTFSGSCCSMDAKCWVTLPRSTPSSYGLSSPDDGVSPISTALMYVHDGALGCALAAIVHPQLLFSGQIESTGRATAREDFTIYWIRVQDCSFICRKRLPRLIDLILTLSGFCWKDWAKTLAMNDLAGLCSNK